LVNVTDLFFVCQLFLAIVPLSKYWWNAYANIVLFFLATSNNAPLKPSQSQVKQSRFLLKNRRIIYKRKKKKD
jgi:hypothetical protein